MTRPPRLVLAATAAFGLLTAFWSVLTPLAEAPDEPAHLGLVDHVARTGDYPEFDGLPHVVGIFTFCNGHAVSVNWCTTPQEKAAGLRLRPRSAATAPSKDDRMHWSDPAFYEIVPDRLNQMPQHPPLYYYAMGAALRVERALVPGELSVDTELAYLRLLNVLVVLPLPWLAWMLARRLGLGDEIAVLASLLPLAVPQLTHIGGTLNNDNLFMVLVSALMVLLAGVTRGDRSRRTALLVGLVTGMALLTKGFGIVLPPIVLAAYWLGTAPPRKPIDDGNEPGTSRHVRFTRRGRQAVPPAVGALVVGLAASGWWYLDNLVTTGHIMPSIEDSRLSPANRLPELRFQGFNVGEYVTSTSSRLVESFWGDFGWRRVDLPPAVSVVATLLCAVAVHSALRRPPQVVAAGPDGAARSTPGPNGDAVEDRPAPGATPSDEPIARSRLALLLAPITMLAAFVIIRAALIYRDSGQLRFQQGRYLFAGLSAAAVVVAVGAHRLLGRRALPAAVAVVLVLQGLAVLLCLDGWWGPDGVPVGAILTLTAWSGWPDPIVVAFLVAAPAQLGFLTWAAHRHPVDRVDDHRDGTRRAPTPASVVSADGGERQPLSVG